jgi:hypothetical protein
LDLKKRFAVNCADFRVHEETNVLKGRESYCLASEMSQPGDNHEQENHVVTIVAIIFVVKEDKGPSGPIAIF